jgi:transposase InsO family protein
MINEAVNTEEVRILTKTALAKKLGVSRSSLYYKPKQEEKDKKTKSIIEETLKKCHDYGHKRIAVHTGLNKKRVLRVMKKYGITPYKKRGKKPVKKEDLGRDAVPITNHIKRWCPIRPNVVWVMDFTYIQFQGIFLYMATVMDVFTREIIGVSVGKRHDVYLVLDCLKDAIKRQEAIPTHVHMDQGSEYTAEQFTSFIQGKGMKLSYAKKASPWENGFQESFYAGFKLNLGVVERFEKEEDLIEGIYQTIYYYNHNRIHSALKMSPVAFREQYRIKGKSLSVCV